MKFIQNLLVKKEQKIKNYTDFWLWFQSNERIFFDVVKSHKNLEKGFFDKLSSKLDELKEGYFYVTGMYDEQTVELILTADGNPQHIVFVEELVAEAPPIAGWKFTALKPAMDIENVSIQMGEYTFNGDNLFFYSNEIQGCPDEIDICVIHAEGTKENMEHIGNGCFVFLDNYLGELDFLNNIDNLRFITKYEAEEELVQISKLKDFLIWRQKEFIEKYEGVRYDTSNDEHSIVEAELESGNKLIAVINTELLRWDSKASHPWIGILTFTFDGRTTNGMPNENDIQRLNEIEDQLLQQLLDKDGYLNVGRQTGVNEREIYFACKDFRKPSKAFF